MVLVGFGDSYSMIIRLVSMNDDRNLQSYLLFYVNDWILGGCFLLCLKLITDNQLALSFGIWAMSSTAHIFSVDSKKRRTSSTFLPRFTKKNPRISENYDCLSGNRLLFAISSQMNHLNTVLY